MKFNIDLVEPDRIAGWILPDNPSAIPRVNVVVGDELVATIQASVVRQQIKSQGLHATGLCGFVVDRVQVPDIASAEGLEIQEAETGLCVFRRPPPQSLDGVRLFRLETELLPDGALNDAITPFFHMAFHMVQRLPEETRLSVFRLGYARSLHLSGRAFAPAVWPAVLEREFMTCVILRDPAEELAERLLVLKWAAARPRSAIESILGSSYDAILADKHLADLSLADDAVAWLERLSPEARRPLENPLARLLTCRDATEPLPVQPVAEALSILADFDLVGFRDGVDSFCARLSALIEVEIAPPGASSRRTAVERLASSLRGTKVVDDLLAVDLAIVEAAREALRRAEGEVDPEREDLKR
jgi:hypothetical protein